MYVLIGIALSMIISCGTAPEPTSLKWGHLKSARNALLLKVPPDGNLGICGPYADDVSEAVRTWAAVINRAEQINISDDCRQKIHIKTEAWSHARICQLFSLPINCRIVGFAGGNQLVIREDFPLDNNLVLHEVGHLWGMCDQYRGNTRDGWMNNCNQYYRSSQRHGESAMGAAYKGRTALTADDIKGIKALAIRNDIPMNSRWGH